MRPRRAAGRRIAVLLRIVPEVGVDTHEKIATGHEASTFGIPRSQVVAAAELAATSAGLDLRGLHLHIGSQIGELRPYLRDLDVGAGARRLRSATLTGSRFPSSTWAVGSRCRTRTSPPCLPRTPQVRSWTASPPAAGSSAFPSPSSSSNPDGASSGTPRSRCTGWATRKTIAGGARPSPSTAGCPTTSDRCSTTPGTRSRRPARSAIAAERTMTIVGSHCESGDVLAEAVRLPDDVGRGDLLAFAATGAYTYSLANTYNRIGRPAVVGVREGRVALWLRREDAADLDRLEVSPGPDGSAHPPPEGVRIRPARPRHARSYLDFWRAIVAEGGDVRTEYVDQSGPRLPGALPPVVDRTGGADRGRRRDPRRRARLHPARAASGHPPRRHPRDRRLGRPPGPRDRAGALGRGGPLGPVRGRREDHAVRVPVEHGRDRALSAVRVRGRRSARGTLPQVHGYEDEILMSTWIGPEPS